MILGIDPGNEFSAYCLVESATMKIIKCEKVSNKALIDEVIPSLDTKKLKAMAIEHMEGYGQSVGREVFETCYYIGKLIERTSANYPYVLIVPVKRKEEKLAITGRLTSDDKTVRHNLIDLFAKHDFKGGKGNKKDPDVFYGFADDMWSAFAICYTTKLKLEGKI